MGAFHNIFACLVHESQECAVDLVRNLRALDPGSTILLYNGGRDPDLLRRGFPFERYGAVVHPEPRPLAWGWLHDFALDCIRFARAPPVRYVDRGRLGPARDPARLLRCPRPVRGRSSAPSA